MKHLQTYNKSIRSLMTPKSNDEIKKSLINLSPDERYKVIERGDGFKDIYNQEEMNDLLSQLSPKYKAIVGCDNNLGWLVKMSIEEGLEKENMIEPMGLLARLTYYEWWGDGREIVRMLINAGCDLNSFRGNLMMHTAASQSDTEILKLILDKRELAPVGERMFRVLKVIQNGKTVTNGDPEILKIIREYRRKVKLAKNKTNIY